MEGRGRESRNWNERRGGNEEKEEEESRERGRVPEKQLD